MIENGIDYRVCTQALIYGLWPDIQFSFRGSLMRAWRSHVPHPKSTNFGFVNNNAGPPEEVGPAKKHVECRE